MAQRVLQHAPVLVMVQFIHRMRQLSRGRRPPRQPPKLEHGQSRMSSQRLQLAVSTSLPNRRIVERTFAWISRVRHMARTSSALYLNGCRLHPPCHDPHHAAPLGEAMPFNLAPNFLDRLRVLGAGLEYARLVLSDQDAGLDQECIQNFNAVAFPLSVQLAATRRPNGSNTTKSFDPERGRALKSGRFEVKTKFQFAPEH
jgi:hypothetical protein